VTNSPPGPTKPVIAWLMFGGFLFGIGWLVGVVRLWDSRTWNVGEKLLGTFVVPFGLAGSLFLAQLLAGRTSETGPCTTPQQLRGCVGRFTISHGPSVLGVVAGIIVLLAPIAMAIYLGRQKASPGSRPGDRIPQADLRSA
jgi:hypothetical protein